MVGLTLRSTIVLAELMPLVVKDGVQRLQVGRVWIEPGLHMLGVDVDDRAVVASSGNFGLRVIRDRREAEHVRLDAIRVNPVRPQTRNEHCLN